MTAKPEASSRSDRSASGGDVDDEDRPRARSWLSRRRVLALAAGVLVVVAVIAVGSAMSLRAALDDARAGRDAIGDFRQGFDFIDEIDETRARLVAAEAHFASATGHLDSRWLALAEWVPGFGTQVDSATSLASGGRTATALAIGALHDVEAVVEGDVADRLAVLNELTSIATRTRSGLATIDLGPESGLIGRLADVRSTVASQLDEVDRDLAVVEDVTRGLGELLAGPTSYLLLVGNNAEMRAGSGSFLAAGVVTVSGGEIEITDLASVHEYEVDLNRLLGEDTDSVPWADLNHTTEWQLLGASPRFDWTAPLALQMWETANGDVLDGVVAVDAVVLKALLAVTGPVEVGGRPFTTDQVLFEILFNQYFFVTNDDYKAYSETQIQRRDRLRELARESLNALEGRQIDLRRLIDELENAIEGRHLMVWSPSDTALWEALGVDGTLEESSLALSLLNVGGNKLDFWTEVFAEVIVTETARDVMVEVRVRVVVDPPDPAPRYVLGPHPEIGENPGDYFGVMVFNVPAAAAEFEVESDHAVRASGADGPTRAFLVDVELPAGTTTDVTVTFRLPQGHAPITVEPSGRVPATRWLFGEKRWRSGAAVQVPLPAD